METRSGRERERKSNFSTRCYFCLVFLRRVQKIPLDFCVWGISRVFLLSSRCSKAFIPERQRRKHDALTKEKEKEKEKEREEERGEKKKKKKKRRV